MGETKAELAIAFCKKFSDYMNLIEPGDDSTTLARVADDILAMPDESIEPIGNAARGYIAGTHPTVPVVDEVKIPYKEFLSTILSGRGGGMALTVPYADYLRDIIEHLLATESQTDVVKSIARNLQKKLDDQTKDDTYERGGVY